ncbi:hypothetical protein AMTRI_Chr07g25770 [Amborella trichopoda]
MVRTISSSCGDGGGGALNLTKMLHTYTNNIVSRVALGKKYYSNGEHGSRTALATWMISRRIDLRQKDLVDILLQLQKDHSLDIPLTTDNIKAIIREMFAAGTETTTATLEWLMSELVRNPISMRKAKEVLRQVVGGKGKAIVEEGDLQQLEYLHSSIKETLRHPDSWERANEFLPERFIKNSIDFMGKDFEFLPFGAGRRGCPGISFGIKSVEVAAANLLHCFDWELPFGSQGLDMAESSGITMHRKSPLLLVATPRCA